MKKTLEFDVFVNKRGKPVCREVDVCCQFLATKRFGQQPFCLYLQENLHSDDWVYPDNNCPLWKEER